MKFKVQSVVKQIECMNTKAPNDLSVFHLADTDKKIDIHQTITHLGFRKQMIFTHSISIFLHPIIGLKSNRYTQLPWHYLMIKLLGFSAW